MQLVYRIPFISSIFIVLSISFFIHGFLPNSLEHSFEQYNEKRWFLDEHECNVKPESAVQKLVLVVIDAWRLGFLTDDNHMSFVRTSYENGLANGFSAKVQTPTVTMPRIKALTSGTVPSFSSLFFNFGASECKADSWVRKAYKAGKRIVFYGDDTWLSLFPNTFERAEGVVSLFVKDFTEVDNNVTRNMRSEFTPKLINEWDVMVLHYLGLDHIGHSLGGESRQIPVKLKELDDLLKEIYNNLEKTNASFSLLVSGDHGMTTTGSHGGASEYETKVPVVIWREQKNEKRRDSLKYEFLPAIEQVDVSTMISSFLKISLPEASVGIGFWHMLIGSTKSDSYYNLRNTIENAKLLLHIVENAQFDTDRLRVCIDQIYKKLKTCDQEKWESVDYSECIAEMRSAQSYVIRNSSSYNINSIYAALAVATVNLLTWLWTMVPQMSRLPEQFFLFTNFVYFMTFFASSLVEEEHDIWYFLFSSNLMVHLIERTREFVRELSREKWKEVRLSSIYPIIIDPLILLVSHRFAYSYTNGRHRRWNMAEGTLPEPMISDPQWWISLTQSMYKTQIVQKEGAWAVFSLCGIVYFVFISLKDDIDDTTTTKLRKCALIMGLCSLLYTNMIEVPRSVYMFTSIVILCFMRDVNALMLWTMSTSRPSMYPVLFFSYLIGRVVRKVPTVLPFAVQAAFFYTGNSNSLSTIDIGSGYTGIDIYIPVVVGTQIMINTYAGVIMVMLGYYSPRTTIPRLIYPPVSYYFFTLRSVSLLGSLLSLFIFSNHLFVFSVFAPRCLYETAHCVLLIIGFFLSSLL